MPTTSSTGGNVDNSGDGEEGGTGTEEKGQAVNLPPGFPVDRGWAWVVMAAEFVISLLMAGYIVMLSVFLLEFVDLFQVPVSSAATPFGFLALSSGFANVLVSHALLPRVGMRKLALSGACMVTLCTASLSLAPDMLFISIMNVFVGAGFSLLYVSSVTLLGHYFNARRSLAMALANSGISVATLVFPPVARHLIASFGPRGALLILSGLLMQSVVAASLLRPVSAFTKRKGSAQREGERALKVEHSEGDVTGAGEPDLPVKPNGAASVGGRSDDDSELHEVVVKLLGSEDMLDTRDDLRSGQSSHTFMGSPVGPASPTSAPPGERAPPPQADLSSVELDRVEVNTGAKEEVLGNHRGPSLSPETDECVSTMSAKPESDIQSIHTVGTPPQPSQTPAPVADEWKGCRCCRWLVTYVVDVSLFKNWLFLLLMVHVPLALMASFVSVYFPSLAASNGVSREDAAVLMSVMGGVGLVGRLLVGFLADLEKVRRTHIVAASSALLGFTVQFCRFYSSFGTLAVVAVVNGVVGSTCQTLLAVVVIDMLGLQRLPKVLGLVLLVQAVWASLNHPWIGALADMTGSFVVPFHYIGACLLLSSLVLLMEPFVRRLEVGRRQQHT